MDVFYVWLFLEISMLSSANPSELLLLNLICGLHYLKNSSLLAQDILQNSGLLGSEIRFSRVVSDHSDDTSFIAVELGLNLNGLNFLSQIYLPASESSVKAITEHKSQQRPLLSTPSAISFVCWPWSDITNFIQSSPWSWKQHLRVDEHLYFVINRNSTTGDSSNPLKLLEIYKIFNSTFIRELAQFEFDYSNILKLLGISSRRWDLNGSVLRLIAQPEDRYKSSTDVSIKNGEVEFLGGAYVDIVRDLQTLLNFKYKIIPGKGWVIQIPSENGSKLTGMAEQILWDEADISVAKNSMYAFRAQDLAFLPAISITRSVAFYKEPPLTTKNIFLMPFESTVWMSLMFIWLLISLSLLVMAKVKFVTVLRSQWTGSKFWLVNAISVQGYSSSSNDSSQALQTLQFTSFTTSSVAYLFYTASFVATMTTYPPVIRGFQDLFQHNYFVFTRPLNQSQHFAQTFIKEPKVLEMVMKKSEAIFTNDVEAIRTVAGSEVNYAFIRNDDGMLNFVIRNNLSRDAVCQLSILRKVNDYPIKDGMFLKKRSPLKELLTQKITLIIERGLKIRYQTKASWEENHECFKLEKVTVVPLELPHCCFAFQCLLGGAILALAVLTIESKKRFIFYCSDSPAVTSLWLLA